MRVEEAGVEGFVFVTSLQMTDCYTDCDWSGEHGTQEDNTTGPGYIWPATTINIPRLDWPDRRQSDHNTYKY